MLRLHFTAEDLLRVTFVSQPAPMMELITAVALLRRRSVPPVLGEWQRRARREYPAPARPLLSLVPPSGLAPMFLDPLSQGLEDGLDLVLSSPTACVQAGLRRLYAAGQPQPQWVRQLAVQDGDAWRTLEDSLRLAYDCILADSWNRIQSAFDAERAWRTRLLAEQGLHATLAGLGPGGRWYGSTLVYDCPEDVEIPLTGHGVILVPSVLWQGRPLVAWNDDSASVLFYPATTPLPLLDAGNDRGTQDGLGVLLGRTRAAVLQLLVRERTTTEVAKHMDISKSSASDHTKALRQARLISTYRDGKAVWHCCTPLGLDLLAQTAPTPASPRARSEPKSRTVESSSVVG